MNENEFYFSNNYLTDEEQEHNVKIIYTFFRRLGWTINAIAGMVGNMQVESYLNPGVWENFDSYKFYKGFGLVQWTPATKFIDWANSHYKDGQWSYDGYLQLQRIAWEWRNGEQFGISEQYPFGFSVFAKSELAPEELGKCFLLNYERPADQGEEVQAVRAANARKWYDFMLTLPEINPIPIWLLFKFRRCIQ